MTAPVLAIVGQTATGKSDLALEVAAALGRAEIVSADAFQLYRGMDIGTAKVPVEERRGIPHHQIDLLDVSERASVAAYQRSARADLDAIARRGHLALVCGGSGLYVRGLLDDFDFPGTDPDLRARIEARLAEVGADGLHAQLRALDPASAERIPAANVRRVVRALEVCELTGRPFSASLPSFTSARPTVFIGVRLPGDALRSRIDRRTRAMFQAGFVDEVRELADDLRESPTAIKATGYARALDVLDGRLGVDEAIAAVAAETWRLARRQATWFRRDPRIEWIEGGESAARELISRVSAWC